MHSIRMGSPCNYKAIIKSAVSNLPWLHADMHRYEAAVVFGFLTRCLPGELRKLTAPSTDIADFLRFKYPPSLATQSSTRRRGLFFPLPPPLGGCARRRYPHTVPEGGKNPQLRSKLENLLWLCDGEHPRGRPPSLWPQGGIQHLPGDGQESSPKRRGGRAVGSFSPTPYRCLLQPSKQYCWPDLNGIKELLSS